MDRDQFLSLPVGIALGVLYDQMPQRMATVTVPQIPRSPKFDGRVSRKGGYCWMSEMDLSGLQYWLGRKQQDTKPEYAERNEKDVKALSFWIAWRTADPQSAWHGERNRQPVRAKHPSRDPELHQWEAKRDAAPSADDYSGSTGSEEGYEF